MYAYHIFRKHCRDVFTDPRQEFPFSFLSMHSAPCPKRHYDIWRTDAFYTTVYTALVAQRGLLSPAKSTNAARFDDLRYIFAMMLACTTSGTIRGTARLTSVNLCSSTLSSCVPTKSATPSRRFDTAPRRCSGVFLPRFLEFPKPHPRSAAPPSLEEQLCRHHHVRPKVRRCGIRGHVFCGAACVRVLSRELWSITPDLHVGGGREVSATTAHRDGLVTTLTAEGEHSRQLVPSSSPRIAVRQQ